MRGIGNMELYFVWNVKMGWILLPCKGKVGQMQLTSNTRSFWSQVYSRLIFFCLLKSKLQKCWSSMMPYQVLVAGDFS